MLRLPPHGRSQNLTNERPTCGDTRYMAVNTPNTAIGHRCGPGQPGADGSIWAQNRSSPRRSAAYLASMMSEAGVMDGR